MSIITDRTLRAACMACGRVETMANLIFHLGVA